MFQLFLKVGLEFTVFLYALSMLFFYIDYLNGNKKAKKVAFSLLLVTWTLLSVHLIMKVQELEGIPITSVKEGLFFYVWIMMILSLILNRINKSDLLVFFINTLGFLMFIIYTFTPTNHMIIANAENLISELLFIHISIAFISYGVLSVSFILSIMYLIEYSLLKKKKWGKQLRRYADLSFLEVHSFRMNIVATAIYMVALGFGSVRAVFIAKDIFWYDPKFVMSIIVLILYGLYLYLSKKKYIQGKKQAYMNIFCFASVMLNFFLVGPLSSFHYI